ncbi:hypothetical protein CYJ76_05345 [Kytococcus schroeteri]|uniref:DUF4282 domain-containing protein n=1 Tax=Kytococcus schroeteri TaxID=138300 RepID=A0A2I1PB64_9MICO|nr:DUF4282 domain-containing protein [Kytococcus schroeteri]PKZ41875.1 hypothetical protein CYJ76_05345 [Kytococcus schroeteri]
MSTPYSDPYPPSHGGPAGQSSPTGTEPAGAPNPFSKESGFFSALTDLRFTKFVTPKVVSVVYVLMAVAIAIGLLMWTIIAFATMATGDGEASAILIGLVMLVAGPIVALLYLVLARVSLEGMVAVIRIAEDVAAIRRR